MWVVASLLLGLFAPFALLACSYHVARRLSPHDADAAWFGHAQRNQWILVAGLLGWPMVVGSYSGGMLINALYVRLHVPYGPLATTVIIVPPALLLALSGWLTEDLARRVRGIAIGPAESARNAVLRAVGLIVPVVGLTCAFEVWRQGGTLWGLLIVCGALAICVAALRVSGARATMTPHAVSSGPLRDRVFVLAARAGVKLRQLYVVPFSDIRMANAFAVQGDRVILTDYLLQHLDRDEVDAVLAHEMAHLKLGHPRLLGWALLGLLTALMTSAMLWHVPGAAALALFPGLLAFFALSRRFERAADAGAIELGARPDALITGLVRLGRLNHVPLRWSRAREWLITHPSTERRAHAIGAHGRLSAERVAELIATALAPGAPTTTVPAEAATPAATAELYALPVAVTRGKVFATPFKQRVVQQLGMALLGVSVGVPVLIVASAAIYGLALPRLAFILGAALAGALACVVVLNFASAASLRGLARPLASRCTEDGIDPHANGAHFVGLTPDARVRLYEGFSVWDVGYLALAPGRLDYLGEETRFTIAAEDVTGIALADGLPGWLRVRGVRVDWRRPDGLAGSFALAAAGSRTLLGAAQASRALLHELERWRSAASLREPAAPTRKPWMGPPPIAAVTSDSPAAIRAPGALLGVFIWQLLIAFTMLLVLRVPLWSIAGPGLFEVAIAAFGGYLLLALPQLCWRDPAVRASLPPVAAERDAA